MSLSATKAFSETKCMHRQMYRKRIAETDRMIGDAICQGRFETIIDDVSPEVIRLLSSYYERLGYTCAPRPFTGHTYSVRISWKRPLAEERVCKKSGLTKDTYEL